MNMAFQVEVFTQSDGNREIVGVECDPTADEASSHLEAEELGVGAWEFLFVVPADFDGSEAVFRKFQRYGLAPQSIYDACVDAKEAVEQS